MFWPGQRNTFRPKKQYVKETTLHALHKRAKSTLHAGDYMAAVEVPPSTAMSAWLAVNTIDFFNQVNLLFGAISDFCTATACPTMSAGPFEYLWGEGSSSKTPEQVSASQYVTNLMNWIQGMLDDQTIFPLEIRDPPPKNFPTTVKKIFTRLFRVYAHMYYSHLEKLRQLELHAHFNTGFKHFYLFVRRWNLIEKKQLAPMQSIIDDIHTEYGLKP
ncbi:MOB kinase activator 1A [Pelomyxa schiedti]|nr:MOB kinase activator 1A [Pelomyxa schiedti]